MTVRKILIWVVPLAAAGLALTGGGVVLTTAGLTAPGLDEADKWASVIGALGTLAGLVLSGYGALLAGRRREPPEPPAGQTVADSTIGGAVVQARGVPGDRRGDQTVTGSSVAGSVWQVDGAGVDGVGGDARTDR